MLPFRSCTLLVKFAYFSSDALSLRTSRNGTKFARKYIGLIKDRREVRVRRENANSPKVQLRNGSTLFIL